MDENTTKLFGSKKTDDWGTPPELYNKLNEEFNFNFDPCPHNPVQDGLKINWGSRCFVNPPYSKVKEFLKKSEEEMQKGNTQIAVFLIFSNTDTKWFHEYIYHKAEIRFLKGRLKFLDQEGVVKGSAMRPSMVVIFKK